METGNKGHRKMVVWQNIDKVSFLVNQLIKKIPYTQLRLIKQIISAMDSAGSNFVEGYYSSTIPEYLRFLHYSKRSLAEVQERIRRCFQRNYFSKTEYLEFDDWAIKTLYLFDRLIFSLTKKQNNSK